MDQSSVPLSTEVNTGYFLGFVGGLWKRFSQSLFEPRKKNIITVTADRTLTDVEAGSVISNVGATGTVQVTLPPAVPGLHFFFIIEAVQQLRINPDGTQTIALPATGVQQAAGKYIVADAIGERIYICCVTTGTWDALNHAGTFTVEP